MNKFALLCAASTAFVSAPALAQAGPYEIGENTTLDPIIEGTLRYESVSQPDTAADDADALTFRIRSGAEFKTGGLFLLAEAEATLAIIDDYNDTIPGNGVEPYSVVADPDNIELNRLAIGYSAKGTTVTLGRQAINLDDQRFVGAVAWRQNEQTFDAARVQTKIGPVSLDGTYSFSQRTIFGVDSPNEHFDGNIYLVNGGFDLSSVKVKAFAYLIDYDTRLAYSSQTYGVRAAGAVPLGGSTKLNYVLSYAKQSDYGDNPIDYSADYIGAEAGLGFGAFGIKGGYELLGSDDGVAAFQTPLATLHKFNGFADLFLSTPANGLQDYYGGASYKIGDMGPLKGLAAGVTYHKFESDEGGMNYGDEIDATLAFKVGKVGLLAKYANYNAKEWATDTEKFWFQASFSY
ncbi:hypothetical protein GCM10010990_11260 [Croceicoccus mobilis]|uniref:Alginate export domain-containing protein n=1 Tax=Croceicoccus mobilis TaxID=1703339 RepID=A0A916YVS5_9SPHN|nr:alginate export family protein [Croceicoccus mobilis]GGD63511.1 hypothetical protein GCM10010990_11260 [Croceicoccus mobilis]